MRINPESLGLEFGELRRAPWVDVLPLGRRARPITPGELREAVLGPAGMIWQRWENVGWQQIIRPGVARLRGVTGILEGGPHALAVRFLYPRDLDPLEALYQVDEAEQRQGFYPGLPPAVAGAALAAATAKELPNAAPGLIASACHTPTHEQSSAYQPGVRLNRRALEEMAAGIPLKHLVDEGGPEAAIRAAPLMVPNGSVDRARFWLLFARNTWQPALLASCARTGLPRGAQFLIGSLAAAHLWLQGSTAIEHLGVRCQVDPAARAWAWPQIVEWQAGGIEPDTLRWLSGGKIGAADTWLGTLDEELGIYRPPDNAPLAHGLAAALLREAEEQAVFVPAGRFIVELPAGYPLRQKGVKALRVAADPAGLWCQAVNEGGQGGVSWRWQPGQPLRQWVIGKPAEPLISATCAALWRDLRVAGEEAVPRRGQAPGRPASPAGTPSSPSAGTRRHVRALPARRIELSGAHDWASPDERAHIRQRQSHGVRGFCRPLHPGWHASAGAIALAQSFNIVVPDGYTFVQPHFSPRLAADQPAGAAPAETIVRARGLAAVMGLLGLASEAESQGAPAGPIPRVGRAP